MHLAKILDDMAGLLEHWGTTPGLLARVKETAARPVVGAEYIHSKSGNRYTVLHVGVYCGKHEYLDACADGHPERAIGFPEGTEIVVYVGHYDNVGKPGRQSLLLEAARGVERGGRDHHSRRHVSASRASCRPTRRSWRIDPWLRGRRDRRGSSASRRRSAWKLAIRLREVIDAAKERPCKDCGNWYASEVRRPDDVRSPRPVEEAASTSGPIGVNDANVLGHNLVDVPHVLLEEISQVRRRLPGVSRQAREAARRISAKSSVAAEAKAREETLEVVARRSVAAVAIGLPAVDRGLRSVRSDPRASSRLRSREGASTGRSPSRGTSIVVDRDRARREALLSRASWAPRLRASRRSPSSSRTKIERQKWKKFVNVAPATMEGSTVEDTRRRDGSARRSRTLSWRPGPSPCRCRAACLSDDVLETFARQAAAEDVMPQIAVADPSALRKALEVAAR
jgi:hypothetical protein